MRERTDRDELDPAFEALLAHNERVRSGRRPPRRGGADRWLLWAPIGFILLVAGVAAALAGGVFSYIHDDTPSTHAAQPRPAPKPRIGTALTSGETATTTTTAASPSPPAPTTTTAPTTTAAAEPVRFVLRATRGDCWVLVRENDAAGRELYSGIIRQGTAVTVRGRRLWVRFGSVGNLDLYLNGKAVRPAHSGTVDAVVTQAGIGSS
jgi:cytoskeletal protein RodZ